MLRRVAFLTAALVLGTPASSPAYRPAFPRSKGWVFASPMGNQGLRVSLDKKATFFEIDAAGDEVVIWRSKVVDVATFHIHDTAPVMVATDQSERRTVVVYGQKGEILAVYKLADLFTPDEIRNKMTVVGSGPIWTLNSTFRFDRSIFRMRIQWTKLLKEVRSDGRTSLGFKQLPGGKLIEIEMTDGRIVKSEAF